MKKLILLLLIVPFISLGQIKIEDKVQPQEIGAVKSFGVFLAQLDYYKDSNSYLLSFRDLSYQRIIEIKNFEIKKDDIDSFYNAIESNISNKSDEEIEVTLDNKDVVTLHFDKKKVQFLLWNGVTMSPSQYLSLKQIKKLFGK